MGGRKGRNGLFPATACIKLAGVYDDTGDRITVRACALDSGTLTTDTEIIRMSHCGGFYFDDRYGPSANICSGEAAQTKHINIGFEVLTAVVLKVAMLRNTAPCSPYMNQRFEGMYHILLQGRKSAKEETRVLAGGIWTQCIHLAFSLNQDRLCGLVVRVLGYRSGGPGSIPGTTRKKK
jgi:hypothetical protein